MLDWVSFWHKKHSQYDTKSSLIFTSVIDESWISLLKQLYCRIDDFKDNIRFKFIVKSDFYEYCKTNFMEYKTEYICDTSTFYIKNNII